MQRYQLARADRETEIMTQSEFNQKFDLGLLQYQTMDASKCERFGELIQGFVGVKEGNSTDIFPFSGIASQIPKIKALIWENFSKIILASDFVGVSFVQHYIHYT